MSPRPWLGPVLVPVLLLACSALAPSAAPPDTKPTPPWKLAEAKHEAAMATCRCLAREYQEGKATHEQVAQWSRRWRDAQREVKVKKSEQQTAFEEHVKRMEDLEKAVKARYATRQVPPSDVSAVEYLRIDAELELSRNRASK